MKRRAMIAWWSADSQPTLWRNFIMISAKGRPIIECQSADDRQTVGRCHSIKESSADWRWISAVVRPMVARLSADHKMWFVFYSLIMHISALFIYEIKSCICVILGFISLVLVCKYHLFFGWISNWTVGMTFYIYVSTSPKDLKLKLKFIEYNIKIAT